MSDQFKALILDQKGEEFTREIKSIDKSFLKHGDVTIKVDYSDLNFKDGMILKNGGRLVKEFPHIPGIDFSGKVLESENSKFKEGDEIILTGFRGGEVFSKRLQTQERLTMQIARTLMESLDAKGVAVTIDSTHQCMTMRGIKKEQATTVTNYYLGQFKEDLSYQNRYLRFISIAKE